MRERMRAATNPANTQSEGILTALEIAAELRCSKAQVYRLMNGEIDGLTPLPTLPRHLSIKLCMKAES